MAKQLLTMEMVLSFGEGKREACFPLQDGSPKEAMVIMLATN